MNMLEEYNHRCAVFIRFVAVVWGIRSETGFPEQPGSRLGLGVVKYGFDIF